MTLDGISCGLSCYFHTLSDPSWASMGFPGASCHFSLNVLLSLVCDFMNVCETDCHTTATGHCGGTVCHETAMRSLEMLWELFEVPRGPMTFYQVP